MARQKIVLEFILPEGEDIKKPESKPLLEWFAQSAVAATLQGIDFRVLVDGEELVVKIDNIVMPDDMGGAHA